jgi:DNA-binding transcriptional ArsR family regulator
VFLVALVLQIGSKLVDMQGQESTSLLEVRDARAGRFLSDVRELYFLAPLIGQELSASQYSAGLNIKLDAAVYRLRRMVKLGLVRVVREDRRGGSPVKYYTAVAERFFVPFELVDETGLEVWYHRMFSHFDTFFVKGVMQTLRDSTLSLRDLGIEVTLKDGQVVYHLADGPDKRVDELSLFLLPDASPTLSVISVVNLSFEDAKSLQREVIDLLKRYPANPAYKPYLARISLTEFPDTPEGE